MQDRQLFCLLTAGSPPRVVLSHDPSRPDTDAVMTMSRETEVPFSRRSRRGSDSPRRHQQHLLHPPESAEEDGLEERDGASLEMPSSETTLSMLARGVNLTSEVLSRSRIQAKRPQLAAVRVQACPARVAMILGPIDGRPQAERVRQLWDTLPACCRDQDPLLAKAVRGELVAAHFGLPLAADLAVIFDSKQELKHHVLKQTQSGELWLVQREAEPRADRALGLYS